MLQTIPSKPDLRSDRLAKIARLLATTMGLAGLAIFASVVSVLAQTGDGDRPTTRPATIVITGTGVVTVMPDIAIVHLGVETAAQGAKAALDENTRIMTDLIAMLKEQGIEKRDIATAHFDLQPRYDRNRVQGSAGPEAPRIVGYVVSNSVNVRVRRLQETGSILDRAARAGANRFSGVRFTLSEPARDRNEARKRAVADARSKAELIAKAAGVRLGRIVSINEAGGRPRPMLYARSAELQMADAPVPIEVGEQEISVSLTMTWELVQ